MFINSGGFQSPFRAPMAAGSCRYDRVFRHKGITYTQRVHSNAGLTSSTAV
jgi:hypothetical protein